MDFYIYLLVFATCLAGIPTVLAYIPKSGELVEICQLDHVTLECDIGHVIVIQSALYGRMRASRCIGGSHVGCVSDVLGWVDRWCSGRHKCYIDEGFQIHLENTNYDCPQYRDKYLQLSYQCVEVVQPMSPSCSNVGMPAAILSNSLGYISSRVTRETSCFRSPWVVVAPPEHSIIIEVLDFSWTLNGQPCDRNYAKIFDVSDETSTTLCRRNRRRHGPYIFDTTEILIKVLPTPQGTEFLLRYAVLPKELARTGSLQSPAGTPTGNTEVCVFLSIIVLLLNLAEGILDPGIV